MRMVGAVPQDHDPDWSSMATNIVLSYLVTSNRLTMAWEEVCRGRVLLHTNTVLWLDTCPSAGGETRDSGHVGHTLRDGDVAGEEGLVGGGHIIQRHDCQRRSFSRRG